MIIKALWATVGVLVAACVVLTVNLRITEGRLDDQKMETARVQGLLDAERLVAQFSAATAQVRYEASEKARLAAVEAGKANRAASTTYLTLPTPTPEMRCEAASELVEQALKGQR